jgi:molybdenum cofactor guanylyltransferase
MIEPMTDMTHDVTGLILAGGQAQRMQGHNKGLQLLQGKPLAWHVRARMQAQQPAAPCTILVNTQRDLPQYAQWHAATALHPDQHVHAQQGPLAGMLTGMLHAKTPWLLVAPCDTPWLPLNWLHRMQTALAAQTQHGAGHAPTMAMACTQDESGREQAHPICCLIRTHLVHELTDFLAAGHRSCMQWAQSQQAVRVMFDDEQAFANINTLEQLACLDQK